MACGSCGGRATPASLTGVATAGTETVPTLTRPKWRVTYPNGATVDFDAEWQAAQAVALSGGHVTVLTPEQRDSE